MLERTPEFQNAQQLHAKLPGVGETLALATVYRLLQSIVSEGESRRAPQPGQRDKIPADASAKNATTTSSAANADTPSRSPDTTVQRWADKTGSQPP
jgi:Fe2+ or Zn2+ uptake regulation protein